jgi:hypothetical protein
MSNASFALRQRKSITDNQTAMTSSQLQGFNWTYMYLDKCRILFNNCLVQICVVFIIQNEKSPEEDTV